MAIWGVLCGWLLGGEPPSPPSGARYGVLGARSGNSEGWEQSKLGGCSALRIPIRAVWPTIRPFFSFDAGPAGGAMSRPKTTQNGPKQAVEGAPRCLNCVLCPPNWLQGVMEPDCGLLGAFRGRLCQFLANLACFGPPLAISGPPPAPAPCAARQGTSVA